MSTKFKTYFPTFEDRDPGLAASSVDDWEVDKQQEDQIQEMADSSEGLKEAVVALEQLKGLNVLVKNAEQRGGMSSSLAQVAAYSHRVILGNIGYTAGKDGFKKPIASLENFKSESTRKIATLITFEEIETNKKSLIEKIKKILLGLLEKAKVFLSSLFSIAGTINAKIERADKLVKTGINKPVENTVNLPSVITSKGSTGGEYARSILESCNVVVKDFPSLLTAMKTATSDADWANKTVASCDSVIDSLPNSTNGRGNFSRGRTIDTSKLQIEKIEIEHKPVTVLSKNEIVQIGGGVKKVLDKIIPQEKEALANLQNVIRLHQSTHPDYDYDGVNAMSGALVWITQNFPKLVITSLNDVAELVIRSASQYASPKEVV